MQNQNQDPKKNPEEASEQQPFSETDRKFAKIKIALFCVLMVGGFLVGLLFFLRPAESAKEKRKLTEFPAFTIQSFLSGAYTNQISTWYADTYPFREALIGADQSFKSLSGFRGTQLDKGNKGDKIDTGDTRSLDDILSDLEESRKNDPITDPAGDAEMIEGYYIVGDTAYELYAFSQMNSLKYAQLINQAAASVSGKAKVYDLIVPLSYAVALSPETQKKINASDCEAAIAYMYRYMDSTVRTVDAMSALRAHRNEYLYYRTDHHWTALGAYYAYTAFCESAGVSALPLSSWQEYRFEGFLGTLYNHTGSGALAKNPDTVYAYLPNGTNSAHVTERNGKSADYAIMQTATDRWYPRADSKYNCFIAGDNPLTEIHNPLKSDGSSIVVVKESFGNAFVPFLVDSYEYVYVIDYRYYTDMTLSRFVTEKNIDTVLFINNVIATSAGVRLDEMGRLIRG